MATEEQSLNAMTETFPQIDQLRTRFASADEPPCDSALAVADAVWPHLPISEHARQCLASSWDHFDLVRLTVEQRRTFPTGLNGVLRGGLVASSMALWLLGPDDPETRVQRGLALSHEWYHRRIQYQRELASALPDGADRQRILAQVTLLESDQSELGRLRTGNVQVNATNIIDWSAAHHFGPTNPLRKHVVLEWRRLGGDAHALGWQLMLQSVEWSTDELGTGPVEARVTGTIQIIAEPYLAAWQMFEHAMARFDQLGSPSGAR
jgi:hypothetical protein